MDAGVPGMKRLLFFAAIVLIPAVVFAQRLPRDVIPIHYDLTLTPHLAEETFDGRETITVSVQRPTHKIILNALEMEFQSPIISSGSDDSSRTVQHADVTFDASKEIAILTVPQPIAPGPAAISIQYKGRLNRDLRGFYIGDSGAPGSAKSDAKNKYAASQGEATDIRRAFPSFDEPAMKATYSITMIVDSADAAISNSAVASDTPGPGPNRHTVRFATTPRLSSYLVALAAGDFHCIADEVNKIPLRICALGNKSSLGRFSLQETKGILEYFNNYYGIPYPFDKLDQIGIPDFSAGAMENPGAIVYRESALLSDPKTSSISRRKGIASTISHEIAHMWFGDLVTMSWWNDVWLNEGFATWMSSKPLKKNHPEWRFDLKEISDTAEAMDTDVLSTTRPVRANGETSREIDALFDSIAYQKTASLLRMIESYIGEDNFRTGVNSYLERHAFGNAESFDFFDALASVSKNSADEVMNNFVNQPGVPLLSVEQSCEGNSTVLHIRQSRFLESKKADQETQQWVVPVCPSAGGADQTCELLRNREQTIRIKGCKPVTFLNRDGKGYFISEYQPEMEALLLRGVDSLPEQERMVFARDEWYLVSSGMRPVGNYLQLATALQKDREPEVQEALLKNLQYIADHWTTPENLVDFQSWTRTQLKPIMDELGNVASPSDSENVRLLRGDVLKALAVTAKDPEAVATIHRATEAYLKDRASLDPDMAPTVLEAAAAGGDAKLYDEITAAYLGNPTPEEHRAFLEAIAQFRDPALLQRPWSLCLDGQSPQPG